MICNKDLIALGERQPNLLANFLKDPPGFWDESKKTYFVGAAKIHQGDYYTSCNCKEFGKIEHINGTYRCICSKCETICNRCMMKVLPDANNKESICESCSYMKDDFQCVLNKEHMNRKSAKCEMDKKEVEETEE